MKGIILAGGRATRLYPITKIVGKQMLPVYDKPMIYYPLSVLMLSGIRQVLVISTPHDIPRYTELLGNGKTLGIDISYAVQKEPRGIAESLIIGEDFIGEDNVCLILGDNIFYGHGLPGLLEKAARIKSGARVFGYYVKDPQRYGVIAFDKKQKVLSIQEKPLRPCSNWAITGLYFYDNEAVRYAKALKPSSRNELEITDINMCYLKRGVLTVELLSRGYAWLDTGTPDSLIDAAVFIKTLEDRQGLKIGCIEEVAYRKGFISRKQLLSLASGIKTPYGAYLKAIADDET